MWEAAGAFLKPVLSRIPWRRVARWSKAIDLPPAEGTHFTIVLADLAGDDDGKQTRHVELAFKDQKGLALVRLGVALREPDHGHLADGRQKLEDDARRWLREKNGDILVYGEVRKNDELLRLRFLPREESTTASSGENYRLTPDKLGLPVDFHDAFNGVLGTVVLASIRPATEQQGRYVANLLLEPTEKTRRLMDAPPQALNADSLATLQFFYGLASLTLGEQMGDNEWLTRACDALNSVLNVWTRERVPLQWAATQNNLGNALARLGERERSTTRLEDAVAAFREALKEYTRERVPLQWATTQNNLGNALRALGEIESDTARLEEAVAAYREALKERTRERVPLQWATTQNNLGNALQALGERERDTARMEQAVQAFREALKEQTRERVPLQWAMTQNNLGSALQALGEIESDMARMEQAVQAFREALDVFRIAGATHYIDVTARNLTRAEALLAKRQGPAGTAPG